MRISDWSSDVCSSDLPNRDHRRARAFRQRAALMIAQHGKMHQHVAGPIVPYQETEAACRIEPFHGAADLETFFDGLTVFGQIRRASCRERGGSKCRARG